LGVGRLSRSAFFDIQCREVCRMNRHAFARTARVITEPLERRVLLSAAATAAAPWPAPSGSSLVEIQSEAITAPLDINRMVSAGQATVTATPFDIGSIANIFDGDNSSLYRSANINPATVEITFNSPKVVRQFTLRFSHAPLYRWKVEAAPDAGSPYAEIVPWTSADGDVDSTRALATPVSAKRLRLTAQRLAGDNYVHLDEWKIVGDLVINSLVLNPATTSYSLRQYQQQRVRAEGVTSDGSRMDLTDRVTWTSSNPAVATADGGLIRALAQGSATVAAVFGSLRAQTAVNVGAPFQRDLDVTYIERTPRYNYDAAKNNPVPGDAVTFRGHVRNWDNVTPTVDYRWLIDGQIVSGGTLTDLAPNEERVVTLPWTWQAGPHRVKLVVDPDALVPEASEVNNSVEDRTDGLAVGFWVEQSLYDYFHQRQKNLGIGSNSWEDWAQRQMTKWNEYNASAVWDGITPNGVTDRVRVDKITVVPDGALPLNGGLAGNNPDSRDKTPDLVWGFPSSALNGTFYSDTTSKTLGNPFYLEPSLRHEMGHARYLVDNYTWDVANNTEVTQVQITDPTTGQPVAGSTLMPWLAFDSVLYYNQSGGIMTGPWGNNVWSPHEAGALQRIAGRRAVSGNMNAPGNFGEFLNDIPTTNRFHFVDGAGNPLAGASVRWYAASPGPGYGGKTFDNTPEYTLTADASGSVTLPGSPFIAGQHKEAVIRVEQGGQIWYRFFEVADMNLEYWRGNKAVGNYTIELPLRASAPEMDVTGLGTVSIADGDTTPSLADGTDFGAADVYATGPGLGLDDPKGYVIRTFAVKNHGGQPLRLTGGNKVVLSGPNASDFSVVYQPADTITSETLTVFQIKFDPRAAGTRPATVTVADNDSNENPYNFTIQGTGVVGGAAVPGMKFNDLNADGDRDPGEPGMAGWTVFADLNGSGAFEAGEPSVVSGADGTFTLAGLPTDRITKVYEVQQGGWRQTYPEQGYYVFNPFIDAIQLPFDFGNTQTVRVSGAVFDDRNANGVRDAGEPGIAGRTVYADLDGEDTLDAGEPAAVTDVFGNYFLDLARGLDEGVYVLKQVSVGGWAATTPASRTVSVADGQPVAGVDFGHTRQLQNAVFFYNSSALDGNDPAAGAADDAARDVFRPPLLPGQTGSFLNISGYSKGLNGVMLDVGDLPPAAGPDPARPLTLDDFDFRVGTGDDPSSWAAAPAPADVVVRDGAGAAGSDRVTIVWPDNAIRNTWLQVTLKATERTGFAAPQVFYFGSIVGEATDGGSPMRVTALDVAAVKRALNTDAAIDSRVDFNRDGRINALDVAVVKQNLGRSLLAIRPPPTPSPAGPSVAAALLRPADDDNNPLS
jgi:hypothetical protein